MSSTFPLSPQFTTGETVTAAILDAAITTRLNDLYSQVTADTGWQNLTIASGFQAGGLTTQAPQYRVRHGDVEFQGFIQPSPAGSFAASSTITICPAGALPVGARTAAPNTVLKQCAGSAPTLAVRIAALADGSIQIYTSATPPTYVSIADLSSYPADA